MTMPYLASNFVSRERTAALCERGQLVRGRKNRMHTNASADLLNLCALRKLMFVRNDLDCFASAHAFLYVIICGPWYAVLSSVGAFGDSYQQRLRIASVSKTSHSALYHLMSAQGIGTR
ncbi:hypothetical protein MRX96_032840 [Rhipicephalus microplus]